MNGEEAPWPFYEQPELSLQEGLYLAAWYDLSTERPIGMAEGYIPLSKMKAYGVEDLGLSGDNLDFFISVMRRVDGGYLSNENGVSKNDPHVREEVSINNVAGVKNLLARLGAAAAKTGGKDRYRKSGKRNARKRHRPDHNDPA
jgi:hypothetical protein